MPCYSGDDGAEELRNERRTHKKVEAMLCAALNYIEKSRLNVAFRGFYDEREVGVSYEELRDWKEKHDRQDAERRRREQQEKQKAEARDRAMAKLSPAERKALGLKD